MHKFLSPKSDFLRRHLASHLMFGLGLFLDFSLAHTSAGLPIEMASFGAREKSFYFSAADVN